MTGRVVVVGAGLAGVQVADSLRRAGHQGEVCVVGEETDLPYERPPLSKEFLRAGTASAQLLRAERFYTDNRIDLVTGVSATGIDRHNKMVGLCDGTELAYSTLVLATGATAREIPVTGGDLRGVHPLRTLGDAAAVRAALDTATSVLVVGAGFIGLEFAAAARARSLDVTVLEAAGRPLSRALSDEMSAHLARFHRSLGVDLFLGEGLAALTGRHGRVCGAVSTAGTTFAADLVVVGVGVSPRDERARTAGLPVDDGIVVDRRLQTADPAIFAAGDCASFPFSSGTRIRIESVQNATAQAQHVSRSILGAQEHYAQVPWFWSNQGGLRLQIAGIRSAASSSVVGGDVATGSFSVLSFDGDHLVAVESVNRPRDHVAARKVLAGDSGPSRREASRPMFSLREFSAPQQSARLRR